MSDNENIYGQMIYRPLSLLNKLENNPRTISDHQFEILCKSISDNPGYFEARPLILSDRTGKLVILAGNQRYDAARYLKLEKVPTFLLEGLTEEKEKEIIIRDNVNNGEWDYELLGEWNSELLEGWGVPFPDDSEGTDIVEMMTGTLIAKEMNMNFRMKSKK